MVIPSSPTVPSNEDGNSGPEPALNDGVYLVDSPLHARGNISHVTPTRVGWMFVKLAWSQDPGNIRQLSGRRILGELFGGELVLFTDTAEILKRVASIVAPCQVTGFEALWKRGGDSGHVSWFRVVYEGRVGGYEHQMVRRRRSRHFGEILVADSEFSRIRKVGRYVSLDELLPYRRRLPR